MEVSSPPKFFSLQAPNRYQKSRFLSPPSKLQLCKHKGHDGGWLMQKCGICGSYNNSAPNCISSFPRRHTSTSWQDFNRQNDEYKLHGLNKLSASLIARSAVAGPGTPAGARQLSGIDFRFRIMALLHGKGRNLLPSSGPLLVSHSSRSEFLKLSLNHGGSSLDFLKRNCTRLKFPSRISSKKYPPSLVVRNNHPQNADFPRYYSKKEKKPFPTPIVELRRSVRERLKKNRGKPVKPVSAPKNGMVIKSLIPTAYGVLNARTTLINNLKKLLKVVPVHACGWCNEIHVGPVGHPFKSCKGQQASLRKGHHEWTQAFVEDVFLPVEAYHLYDRLGRRIPHDRRFSVPRIPAVVELCIQAGVDIPELPTKRRRRPIIRIGKSEFIDADESDLPDLDPEAAPKREILTETPDSEIVAPSSKEEIVLLAEETLQAWGKMRRGANRLMRMYPVRVCGYCPEIHVGASGHKAQNCGAHKHQQRNGQHGWQKAVLNDLIPPRYVWHVPDVNGGPLQRELRNFYGQAPAVVEMCVQAGAAVPDQYKPTMRLDVGIPTDLKEAEMVV